MKWRTASDVAVRATNTGAESAVSHVCTFPQTTHTFTGHQILINATLSFVLIKSAFHTVIKADSLLLRRDALQIDAKLAIFQKNWMHPSSTASLKMQTVPPKPWHLYTNVQGITFNEDGDRKLLCNAGTMYQSKRLAYSVAEL